MVIQESEHMDAGKENCPVSKTENSDKLIAKEFPKEDPVTKPVEGAVALQKSQLGFKALGAVIVVLLAVLSILIMTMGSPFAVSIKHNVTAFGVRISEKAASLLTKRASVGAVCATFLSVAIGLLACFVKKRLQAKKAA